MEVSSSARWKPEVAGAGREVEAGGQALASSQQETEPWHRRQLGMQDKSTGQWRNATEGAQPHLEV